MHSKLEKLLLGKRDEDLDELIVFHWNDFEKDNLMGPLDIFLANYAIDENATVHVIIPDIKN